MFVRKPKGFEARRRAAKRRRLDMAELREMNKARKRDDYCRFPLCGCQRFNQTRFFDYKAEVSHAHHRGMAGDATGERTQAPVLLLLCNWRHKLAKFSVDQKTIRWVPLTDAGADGPIRWLINLWVLDTANVAPYVLPSHDEYPWAIIATETEPHAYEPPTKGQTTVLSMLSEMTY